MKKRTLCALETQTNQPANREEIAEFGINPYCEDPAMSMAAPGCCYKGLLVPADTVVISDEDRQAILDMLCCFYDFSGNRAKSSGVLMNAWESAVKVQEEQRPFFWASEKKDWALLGD